MPVYYVRDVKGETIAVQIPISDWEKMKVKYPDLADVERTQIDEQTVLDIADLS
jgi:hypothetical protein